MLIGRVHLVTAERDAARARVEVLERVREAAEEMRECPMLLWHGDARKDSLMRALDAAKEVPSP